MAPDRAIYRAIAMQDERIVGLAVAPDGLDNLIGGGTRILDEPSMTVLSAFIDTHNHLLEPTSACWRISQSPLLALPFMS